MNAPSRKGPAFAILSVLNLNISIQGLLSSCMFDESDRN